MTTKKSSGKSKASRPSVPKRSKPTASTKAADKIPVSSALVSREGKYAVLKKWNFIVAGIFAVQTIGVLLLLNSVASYSIMSGFLAKDTLQSAAQGQTVFSFALHYLFSINIAWLIGVALAVAAGSYFFAATKWRQHYEAQLATQKNALRWYGLMVSGSLVMVAIALLSGVQDLALLLTVVGLVIISGCGFLLTERLSPEGKLTIGIASVGLSIAWLVIVSYLAAGLLYGNSLSAYVYTAAALGVVSLIALFALVLLAKRGHGKFSDYMLVEKIHMILNLVVLSGLSWLVIAGSL